MTLSQRSPKTILINRVKEFMTTKPIIPELKRLRQEVKCLRLVQGV